MSTIARLSNGNIEWVSNGQTQVLSAITNVGCYFDAANIKIISVLDKQTILNIVYSTLTLINGVAPPESIADGADVIMSDVFFLR